MKECRPRYFYGWNIVAASFVAQLSYAEHRSSVLGFFFKPFQSEFGWSRTAIATVMSISRLVEALIAPIIGPLVDKHGPRVLMPIGAIIVGLAMMGITRINAIWQFYMLRGVVVATGFVLMSDLVTTVSINNWFVRKRGRAIAIARSAGNLSNIIMTPVTIFIIASSGWRTMFVIFAVITWLAVLIPSSILMRRRPEDIGLHPDGIEPGTNDHNTPQQQEPAIITAPLAPEPVWSRRETLMTGTFWLLSIAFAIDSMAFQGINLSLAPYIQDLGYSDTMLAAVVTFRAIIMTLAVLSMGLIADYAHGPMVRTIPFVIQGIGAFLFLWAKEPVYLWIGVALYGAGNSGVQLIQEVIWANYFGRLSLGLVRSLAYLAAFGPGAVGPIAMNAVFDITGSYRPAFMVITGLFAVAAIMVTIAKPPRARRHATAEITAR
ncbi:MAG: MFS transporter [Chloroflexi bacterium]|nr:MFS transporter [Chloroflexota bacterium]